MRSNNPRRSWLRHTVLAAAVPCCLGVAAVGLTAAPVATETSGNADFEKPFVFDARRPAFQATPSTQARAILSADGKKLEVEAGDYRTHFEARPSWTMRSVFYQGACIDQTVGGTYLQCVLNENHDRTDAGGRKIDPFLGSGHRPEQIDDVVVEIYSGTKRLSRQKVATGLEPQGGGDTVVVRKLSRFVSADHGLLLKLNYTTVITPAGVEQYAHLTPGHGDLSKINFIYPFMQMFPNATRDWAAFSGSHLVESGEFQDDNSVSLGKRITGFVTCDPQTETGIYIYLPADYPGGLHNIWNRPHDNKLYFKYPRFRSRDDVRDYRLFLTAFRCTALATEEPDDGSDWKLAGYPSGETKAQFWIKE